MTAKLRTYADQNRAAARILKASFDRAAAHEPASPQTADTFTQVHPDLARYGGPGSLLDRWQRLTLGDPDAALPAPGRPHGTIEVQLEFAGRSVPTPVESAS